MRVTPSSTDVHHPIPEPKRADLERAVLLTVLYADLFDYPLTEDELYRRLILCPADRAEVARTVASLTGTHLARTGPFVVWHDRTALAETRRRRAEAGAPLWTSARRYAGWLAHVPFVQMVAVSGSLAVDNAEPDGDVDLFCITAPNRLWLARLFIVPLSKLTRRLPDRYPHYLCPNYLLTLDTLTLDDRSLFTAHEVVQTVPLWGGDVYHRFRRANPWVADFLPHHAEPPHPDELSLPERPRSTRWAERLLSGRLGDALDRSMHRLFTAFYRRRAVRAGWTWNALQPAYRRDRYVVPEGGYLRVVREHYAERVRLRLGACPSPDELDHLFGPHPPPTSAVYDWESLFLQDYGDGAPPAQSAASSR